MEDDEEYFDKEVAESESLRSETKMMARFMKLLPKVERCIDLLLPVLEARKLADLGGGFAVSDRGIIPVPRMGEVKPANVEFDDAVKKGKASQDVPVVPAHLKVLQDRLVEIIDNNYDQLHDSINALGCRGDCYRCPHPEKPTVEEQVNTCLSEVLEGLDLDRNLINP